MRVIVCGGRDWTMRQAPTVNDALDAIHAETPIVHLWHGNAKGVDTLAGQWALARNVSVHAVPAQWSKYGKQAGPIRNKHMLGQRPDMVIAFPGGRGTAHMVRIARESGVQVVMPLPNPPEEKE